MYRYLPKSRPVHEAHADLRYLVHFACALVHNTHTHSHTAVRFIIMTRVADAQQSSAHLLTVPAPLTNLNTAQHPQCKSSDIAGCHPAQTIHIDGFTYIRLNVNSAENLNTSLELLPRTHHSAKHSKLENLLNDYCYLLQ